MKRVLFVLLCVAGQASAQTGDSTLTPPFPEKSQFKRGLITEFGIMPASTFLPAIRSFFAANQIPSGVLVNLFFHYGVGLRFNRTKVLLQYGSGLKGSEASDPASTTGTTYVLQNSVANYTTVSVGYDLVNSRNRRLYLNAGIGGMSYGFTIFRRTNQVLSFPAILQTSQAGNVSSLLLRNVTYLDINLEYTQREKRKRSAQWVTRLGYRNGLRARMYESQAFVLTNAPRERVRQIYLQLLFSLSTNGDKWRIR